MEEHIEYLEKENKELKKKYSDHLTSSIDHSHSMIATMVTACLDENSILNKGMKQHIKEQIEIKEEKLKDKK
jgi:cell shape-determining protein MreC